MPRLPVGAAALAALALSVTPAAAEAAGFDVLGYELALTPNFADRTLAGRQVIRLRSLQGGVKTLEFTANALDVRVEGGQARRSGGRLLVELDRPLRKGQVAELKLHFAGRPARGVVWGERSIRTGYFTCDWMVCDQDRPGDLATFRLRLEVPPDLKAVVAGDARAAYAPFMFGFAVGPYREVSLKPRTRPELVVLSEAAADADVERMFAAAPQMLAFFEARAGMRLPFPRYVQVFAPESAAQEAAGVSFIGRPQLSAILKDPQEDWVIAHELAHQWWGVLVACEDFSHFWLNEGLATFMTAAWKEHRWGRAAYERELDLARTRWTRVRETGFDRPLAFSGDYPSLSHRRAIVYSKATLFLDELRREVGEAAFWRGLRAYTRRHAFRTAAGGDFQREMEQAAGRELGHIFSAWVHEPAG